MAKSKTFDNNEVVKNRSVEEIIKELKNVCNCERYPMFVSVAKRDKEGKTHYYNDCLLASLEEPSYITRVNKQLLVLNGADIEIPAHIRKCMSDLTSFVEQYKAASLKANADSDLADSKLTDHLMVSEGVATATVPSRLFVNETSDLDIDDLDDLDDY